MKKAKKQLLVVDDDNLVRKTLADMLGNSDTEVTQASNGQEALELATKDKFDLIVTDVHMPVMDGMEFIRQFRLTEHGKTTPVIIMTADGSGAMLNKALVEGVSVYLSKSSQEAEEIVQQIRLAMGLKQ